MFKFFSKIYDYLNFKFSFSFIDSIWVCYLIVYRKISWHILFYLNVYDTFFRLMHSFFCVFFSISLDYNVSFAKGSFGWAFYVTVKSFFRSFNLKKSLDFILSLIDYLEKVFYYVNQVAIFNLRLTSKTYILSYMRMS